MFLIYLQSFFYVKMISKFCIDTLSGYDKVFKWNYLKTVIVSCTISSELICLPNFQQNFIVFK